MTPTEILGRLDDGSLDPAGFSHRDHVRAAHEALRQDEFFAATARFAAGLRRLTERAGVPEKYSATITFAFMSLIAERMARDPGQDAEAFLAQNPDLLTGGLVARHYAPDRLATPLSRRVALMP